jgi:chromosome segregation ATPase
MQTTTRDKDKEIARLEGRLSIAKRSVDDLHARLRDLDKQGTTLAKSLGFETLYEAQTYIDITDDPTPYKELTERLERLRADHENMRAEVQDLQIERNILRAKINISETRYRQTPFSYTSSM